MVKDGVKLYGGEHQRDWKAQNAWWRHDHTFNANPRLMPVRVVQYQDGFFAVGKVGGAGIIETDTPVGHAHGFYFFARTEVQQPHVLFFSSMTNQLLSLLTQLLHQLPGY